MMDEKQNDIELKKLWRGLDELENTEEYRTFLEREFPQGASEFSDGLSRRNFLKIMGASMALAGLAGCRRPVEKIVPYVSRPEGIVPGIPNTYATAMPRGLTSMGYLVQSNDGRPTKIEGNPEHQSSMGGASALDQAQMLALYDPDRSQRVIKQGSESTWTEFVDAWRVMLEAARKDGGASVAVISNSFNSPTSYRLYRQFLRNLPQASWVAYDSFHQDNVIRGIESASGSQALPKLHLDKADIVISFDCDFLYSEPGAVRNAKLFAKRRRVLKTTDTMNRLYVAESNYSITGGKADHRIAVASSHIPALLSALAVELKSEGLLIADSVINAVKGKSGVEVDKRWLKAVGKDLLQNRGKSLIAVGSRQPKEVHALAFALNDYLGSDNKTVTYHKADEAVIADSERFAATLKRIENGDIDTVVVLDCNPAYDLAKKSLFLNAWGKASTKIHFGTYVDETAQSATWHLPATHFLEHWADVHDVFAQTAVAQPLIRPLYNAWSFDEIVHFLASGVKKTSFDLVRDTWRARGAIGNNEAMWRKALHDGFVTNTSNRPSLLRLNSSRVANELRAAKWAEASADSFEISLYASSVGDGRYGNLGWLQENPDPVSKLTWGNAALVSAKTANDLGVKNESVVRLTLSGDAIDIPIWIVPGHANHSISLPVGYGRNMGRVAKGVGVAVNSLRTKLENFVEVGVKVENTGVSSKLATTQLHGSMEDRPIVRSATLTQFKKHPTFADDMVEHPPLKAMWKERPYDQGYQWGMSIDLNACTGCGACTVACQSENNIPIVGKKQVILGREMHWIRIDRYFLGDVANPEMVTQPVPCQHCENAPCEQVCPVAATVHDEEGLNVMTYNRCIGTRYCANNCPYKVRKFNFLAWTNKYTDTEKMAHNPNVTVRSRGVMEKCTFCVQRINTAKASAKLENREVRDGDVVTACQQTCPSDAIVFGNINDKNSKVAKLKKNERDYELLKELNVKTRNTYMARITNPNPEMGQS